jgi:signal peptidase II
LLSSIALPFAVAGIAVAIDQVTKALAAGALGRAADSHRFEVLGSLLAFEYIENTGAAFGVLEGRGVILTLIAGAIVAALVWTYVRAGRTSPVLAVSLGLLIGGALGNIIDRVRLGYVVDFVAVGIWPKFNAADSAVTIGVLMLAWTMARDDKRAHEAHADKPVEAEASGARLNGAPIANRYVEGG